LSSGPESDKFGGMGKPFKIIGASLLVAALALAALIWYGTRVPERGGDFTLKTQQGDWPFVANAKKLNLFYVGYAKCPDVCPMTLSFLADAMKDLTDKERQQVQVLFLSVDVDHDTAEGVATYATQFNREFIGLTGSKDQVDQAMRLVGASYIYETDAKSYLGYSISHTDKVFFLNKKGIVIDEEPMVRSKEVLTEKIRSHL
jgi:protein SCO1/2